MAMSATLARETHEEAELTPSVTVQLQSILRGLKFGSVELTVHDGRIVQIERKERVRFTNGL
jgi:hypothetical protein